MTSPKPIVFFERAITAELDRRAQLSGVTNHPILGNLDWVSTSKVIDIRNNGKTIETLNTIYKQLEG